MAFSLRRAIHLATMKQCSKKCHLPASFLTHSLPTSPSPLRRDFTLSTYETFFASRPPDPTIWNSAIWCSEYYLSALHDVVGLSWGWSIVLGTVLLRSVVTLPLLLYGEVNQDRLELLRQEVENDGKRSRMMAEIEHISRLNPSALPDKRSKEKFLNIQRKEFMRKQYQELNCHPAKMMALPVIQIPLWFASSIATRNMSGEYFIDGAKMLPTRPDLADGTFLWISNLTLPDTSFLIPFFVGLTFLALTEINVYKQFSGQPLKGRGRIITNIMRGVSVFVMPTFAYLVPASVSLYWLSSGVIGLTHNVIAMTPAVRRYLGITLRASPYDTPGRTIWRGFKSYWKI